MNQHIGFREFGGERMVVGDDQLETKPAGCNRLRHTGNTAVDRDDKTHTLAGQEFQGWCFETVSLLKPIGQKPLHIRTEGFEADHQNGCCTHAISVVVAVDRNFSTCPHGSQDPVGSGGNPWEEFWITEVGKFAGKEGPGHAGVVYM